MGLTSLHSPAIKRFALAGALLIAPAFAASANAQSSAPLNLRQALSGIPQQHAPGLASAAPSTQALNSQLEQSTGLSLSEVTSSNVCGSVPQGKVRCEAKALRLRSNGSLVHPRPAARRTLGQIVPRVAGFAPAATAASAPAQSAPSAGTPAYLQQAYDLTYLSQAKGTGDTVAIVDAYDDPTAESDLGVYRSKYGLPSCTTRQRVLPEGERERPELAVAQPRRRLGRGDLA